MDYLFDPVAGKCNPQQKEQLNLAVKYFEACSSLDWSVFIENFPSASMGNAVRCGIWAKDIMAWADKQCEDHCSDATKHGRQRAYTFDVQVFARRFRFLDCRCC